ncbi:variation in compound triggered root growth response-like protein [Tanacetum coccineum]
MSSSKVNGSRFDVFLSFRGQDTRHSFSDHLYDALNRAGISTFRDDEEINKGDELKPEIERAIKESRSSIVVLSKNYATSSWYPSDVRKQTNTFAVEVQDSSRWTDDNVWKAALTEVAILSGMLLYGFDSLFLFVT